MLVADRVCFSYGDGAAALTNVSITLAPGEIVGLTGPSGSGKSTLARILTGYLTPRCRTILIDGRPPQQAGGNPVQMLFQSPELAVNPRWTIREILTEMENHDEDLWYRFGIRDAWLDRYPHELSGGELHRVGIVRALGRQVRYVIADEISGMLDSITQAEIWRALLALCIDRSLGILTISHDERLLQKVAGRTLRMEGGRILD